MRFMTLAFGSALVMAAPSAGAELLRPGEVAPAFVLKVVNADVAKVESFSMKQHVGAAPTSKKSAVLIAFSASFCEPCKAELLELEAMREELAKAEILVVAVGVDTDAEGVAKMERIARELKLSMPLLSDRYGIVSRRYRVDMLPALVAVGADGAVSSSRAGFEAGAAKALARSLLARSLHRARPR
ncbi:MAG: TlpA family protein disulfide reductase [Deltaproteobacteria bacterium]|nr:TlpA family protein disulfide reductase [Deltaproteobacteria bacterium]